MTRKTKTSTSTTTTAPATVAESLTAAPMPTTLRPLPIWLQLCLPLVQISEGCRLDAYPDPATGGAPWTIGWGCTGDDIRPGVRWTQAQADAELERRLRRIGDVVDKLVSVPLTPAQKAALADFCYNLGTSAFESSTLRRLLNAGSYQGAALQFRNWVHAGGRVLVGLQRRRAREHDLFTKGYWQ